MKVLSNLILRSKSTTRLTKFSNFAVTKNVNTSDNHEDFNKVIMGLRVKVRGEQMFLEMRS